MWAYAFYAFIRTAGLGYVQDVAIAICIYQYWMTHSSNGISSYPSCYLVSLCHRVLRNYIYLPSCIYTVVLHVTV